MLTLLKVTRLNMDVKSHREQGDGYPKIIAIGNETLHSIINEVKMADCFEDGAFNRAIDKGQKQYEERHYPRELKENAIKCHHGLRHSFLTQNMPYLAAKNHN